MASAVAAPARASLASSTQVIAKRSLLKFLRTPQLLWTTTTQGVMFLVIFRSRPASRWRRTVIGLDRVPGGAGEPSPTPPAPAVGT